MGIYNPPTPQSIGAVPLSSNLVAGANVTLTPADGILDGAVEIAASGGGGGGAWALAGAGQTVTGIWDQTVDGTKATIDFTGLAGFSDLLLIARQVTKSLATVLTTQVSIDNGATFFNTNGDYKLIGSTGAESNQQVMCGFHNTNTTAASSGWARLLGINVNGIPKVGYGYVEGNVASRLFVASFSPINAIRVMPAPTVGGDLTGGIVYCLAR